MYYGSTKRMRRDWDGSRMGAAQLGRRMGATFHPDSWDFDAATYVVRDAAEETIADLAKFYGVTVHDINVLNGPFLLPSGAQADGKGNPAIYGAYKGSTINMPAAAVAYARTLPCPAGWTKDASGNCVINPNKPGASPPATTPPATKPGINWKKVAVVGGGVAAVGTVGFLIWKGVRVANGQQDL
jgi:hypothetical protein